MTKLRLSRRQVKDADTVAGIELMLPADLPSGDLAEDEDRPADDAEHAAAMRIIDIADLRRHGLLIRAIRVAYVRRPAGVARPKELITHYAYEITGERWWHATNRPSPSVRWA